MHVSSHKYKQQEGSCATSLAAPALGVELIFGGGAPLVRREVSGGRPVRRLHQPPHSSSRPVSMVGLMAVSIRSRSCSILLSCLA